MRAIEHPVSISPLKCNCECVSQCTVLDKRKLPEKKNKSVASFSFLRLYPCGGESCGISWSFISQIFRRGSQSQIQPCDCPMRLTFPVSEVVIVVNRSIRKCSFDEPHHVSQMGYPVHSAIADDAFRSSSLPRPWFRPNPIALFDVGPRDCRMGAASLLSGPMLTLRLLPIGAVV